MAGSYRATHRPAGLASLPMRIRGYQAPNIQTHRHSAQVFGQLGVRVNAVSPGPIETPIYDKLGMPADAVADFAAGVVSQVPLGRFGSAEELADAALFLAGPSATYVQGVELAVDGGMARVTAVGQVGRTTSPSSLVKLSGGDSNSANTASEGRQRRTPRGEHTMGRFTKMGCSNIAASRRSSSTEGSSRPSSWAGDLVVRSAERGVRSAAANSPSNCGRDQPVLRYSMTMGSTPDARIIASTFREVPHSGLW